MPLIGRPVSLSFDSSHLNLHLGPLKVTHDIPYKLGLDLQGGSRLTYEVDMKNIKTTDRDSAFQSAVGVVDRRINPYGVRESSVQSLKIGSDYRIIVELPGASDVSQDLDLLASPTRLSFWENGKEKLATADAILLPVGLTSIYQNKPNETPLTGRDLKNAQVVYGSQNGTPQVQLNFTPTGTKYFADITNRNVGKQVAIVIDNLVISAPVVQQAILSGNAVITGNFTLDQANALVRQLNSGALPAPLKLIGQSTIGPSLGIESLKKSLGGGIIGFLSIIIFMTLLYKKEGILAGAALLIYVIVTLFIFKIIPITLTLAGIAGLILSIGMAVDANILIFERMKEELRLGKPRSIAVKLGFSRAWPSIRDSNISSLITTVILLEFGSSIVKGFAVALMIGIIVSMFSAILVTRNLVRFFEGEK